MEVWKDIEDYKGVYQVSNLGRVRSLDRYVKHNYAGKQFCKGQILKPKKDKDGYLSLDLKTDGKRGTKTVHRLVCIEFIPNIENKPQVNHKNGIKHDNRLENLEWVTESENAKHAYSLGLINQSGEKNNSSKLKEKDVFKIRHLWSQKNHTLLEISKIIGVSHSAIKNVVYGSNWKHIK